jgi:hypothetical protein
MFRWAYSHFLHCKTKDRLGNIVRKSSPPNFSALKQIRFPSLGCLYKNTIFNLHIKMCEILIDVCLYHKNLHLINKGKETRVLLNEF